MNRKTAEKLGYALMLVLAAIGAFAATMGVIEAWTEGTTAMAVTLTAVYVIGTAALALLWWAHR